MVKLNTKFNKILAVMLSLLIIFAAFGNIIPYVVQAEEADAVQTAEVSGVEYQIYPTY